MKKLLITLLAVTISCGAFAIVANDNATSKLYVDTTVATRQDSVDANDANTVMTYTATPGTVGTKGIYDSTGAYAAQENALVPADVANNAIMNAINMEFTCAEYNPNDATDCWKWSINTVPEQSVPSGYTALPYLESTGTQWLDLGMPVGSGENITVKFEYTTDTPAPWFGAVDGTALNTSLAFIFSYLGNYGLTFKITAKNTADIDSNCSGGGATLSLNIPYIFYWHGTPFNVPSLLPQTIRLMCLYNMGPYFLYTPTMNAYLFAVHYSNRVRTRPMRIYYFRVEGKMNLIPARRDSDGELGMYDTIRNTFLTNQGSGKFISGVYTEHVN